MLKLYRHIAFFLLPVLLLVLFLPVGKREKYQGLKEDCFDHGLWVHDRIFENESPVDIAFLGSSHTVNGIHDSLISDGLDAQNVVNFGYCRLGRNFTYALLKELLATKKPAHIIIEVREYESQHSHPIFPYIANTSDVLLPRLLFNKQVLSDIWIHSTYKVELVQDELYQQEPKAPIRNAPFGFAASPDTAGFDLLEKAKLRRQKARKDTGSLEHNLQTTFPKVYLAKIKNVCEEAGVELHFLYLPAYGSAWESPRETELYNQYGSLHIPPQQILQNPNFWHDDNHFNQAGAESLADWLVDELR